LEEEEERGFVGILRGGIGDFKFRFRFLAWDFGTLS
jgi:hypothetical protein